MKNSKNLSKNMIPWLWFLGGFGVGLTMISLGFAAVPAPRGAGLVREIRGGKVKTTEPQSDLTRLNDLEKQYLESPAQQERLKGKRVVRRVQKKETKGRL